MEAFVVSAPGKIILSGEQAVVYGYPAIVAAVDYRLYLGVCRAKEKINELAFEIEKVHHENPSGADNTISTYGGFIYYQKENWQISQIKLGEEGVRIDKQAV